MAVALPQMETEIPIVDLKPYLAGHPGALETTAATLDDALRRLGFVILLHHGVPSDLIVQTFAAARQFHAQREAVKQTLARGTSHAGYQAYHDAHNSSAALYCPHNTPHPWPDLPNFQPVIETYLAAMEALHMRLLPLLATALRLPAQGLDAALGAPMLLLRLSHYPPGEAGAPQSALATHTDGPGTLWTLLPAPEVPGLEVQGPCGTWGLVPVVPESILVNGGQLLGYWSQGKFPALVHRVVSPVGRARYAMPCFIGPRIAAIPYFVKPSLADVLTCPAPPGFPHFK